MEPTIFKSRLKFKPPLKLFKFGHGFFFLFFHLFFQENNLLKVSFMVMAGFNASEGSYQCVFSTAKEMETLDLFVTGEV